MRRRTPERRIVFTAMAMVVCFAASEADAGGPSQVDGDGIPLRWSTTSPVQYSVDGGSLGVWSNATAVANVAAAFNRWGPDLETSALTFLNAGTIPGDGDVNTPSEYAGWDVCDVSPVIFDADGSLFSALGVPFSVMGFAGPTCYDYIGDIPTITHSVAVLNGRWIDGDSSNGEINPSAFTGVLVHEFGHWLNLDHSQVNGQHYLGDWDPGFAAYGAPPLSSVEVMFPYVIGGAITPRKDDVAAISRLYPAANFSATTGSIRGTIRYPDGSTPFQGADVIARNMVDPFHDAVSSVSGAPFSIPPSVGAYELPGLTAGASYSVEIVNVLSFSSPPGPLDPPAVIPGPEEFFNGANEGSANPPDNVAAYTPVASTGGVVAPDVDIIVNVPVSNLSLTISDFPDPVVVGQDVSYTLTVLNSGPATATGVTVTDTLPAGVTFVSAWSAFGSCTQMGGTVTCTFGNIAYGFNAAIAIMVTPIASGTITNTASVSANEEDPNPSNNTASATTTVYPGVDVWVTQNDVPDAVAVGGEVTYTVTVTNNGPIAATGVRLTDTLPAGVTFNSATPIQGTCGAPSGGVLACNVGSLGNAASATVTVVVTTAAAGVISNRASVSVNGTDLNLANNTATETTIVGDGSRLINISTRARVQTGDNVMIGGFIIGGSSPKTVLIRARGGSLGGAPFNNPGVLLNPTMQLFSGQTVIAQNDDWQTTDPLCLSPAEDCGDVPEITATGLDPCQPNPGQASAPPGCAQESALYVTLSPGTYTVIVRGVGGTIGMGLVEVFDVDTTPAILINISTRARVETVDNVMIGGFIVGGSVPKTVLVRARGGSLGGAPFNNPGVLANPTIQLYSGQTVIAQNDNWQTTDSLCVSPATACGGVPEITATALDPCQPNPGQTVPPPGCAQESALYVTLAPGVYTAIVRGVAGTSGMGLVEVFEVSP